MRFFILQNVFALLMAISYIVAMLRAHVGWIQTKGCHPKKTVFLGSILHLIMKATSIGHIKPRPVIANSKAIVPPVDVVIYVYRPSDSRRRAGIEDLWNGRADDPVAIHVARLAYILTLFRVVEAVGTYMRANPQLIPAAPDHDSEPTGTPHRTHINFPTDDVAPQRSPSPVRGLGLTNMNPSAPVPEPVSLLSLDRYKDEKEEDDDFYPDPPE